MDAQALAQRIQLLEQQLENRDQQINQVAAAAAQAAIAANQPAQPAQPAHPAGNHAERRYDVACKSLGQAPKYDAKGSWRTFETSFETWWRVNRIDEQNAQFQKRALLSCMRGQAVEMTRPYNENSDTWNNCLNLAAYLEAFRRIFLPPEESELARSEFKTRKQGRKEDISTYLSSKIALWQLAYPDAERSFPTLMDETIGGIANRVVKRNLRYSQITDITTLRTQAVRIVAAERQCYREGTAESTSLDGLAATTFVSRDNGSDHEMDFEEGVNAAGKFNGNCRKCKKYGHKAADCNKPGVQGIGQENQRKCYRCNRVGHLKKDCHAKTKANGEKIIDKPGDKRGQKPNRDKKGRLQKGKGAVRSQNEVTDEESEGEESDFLDPEGDPEEEQ